MHHAQALAIRRGALAAAGLTSAVAAHAAAEGRLDLLPVAPFLWGAVLSLALLAGPRGRYAPRGPLATVALLLAAQAGFHVLASLAPWAAGFGGHDHAAVLAPAGLAAHAAAAVVLGVLLVRGGRVLDAAVRVAHALRVRLRRPAGPPPRATVRAPAPRPRTRVPLLRVAARGPPTGAVPVS